MPLREPQLLETGYPSARSQNPSACWMTSAAQAILYGGSVADDETFGRPSAGPWVSLQHPSAPGNMTAALLSYDAARDVVVMLNSDATETWEWDGALWTRNMAAGGWIPWVQMSSNGHLVHGYWPGRGVFIFQLGAASVIPYFFNGTVAWAAGAVTTPCPPRNRFSAVYDATLGGILLYGGNDSSVPCDDTWFYNGTDWTQLAPATVPTARQWHSMVYDATYGGTILWGGLLAPFATTNYSSAVYGYKDGDWNLLRTGTDYPPAAPATGAEQVLANSCQVAYYDPGLNGVVIFGGFTAFAGYDLTSTYLLVYDPPYEQMTDHEYYKQLFRSMLPPGAYGSTIIEAICAGGAKLLELAEDDIEQLQKEVVPQTAEDSLGEWEAKLDSPYRGDATDAQRQAALTAVWRMAVGVRPHGLRSVLAPLLNPEYAFRDPCDDNDVSFRYTEIMGNGAGAELADLAIGIPAANDGQWDASNANHYALLLRNHDRADQVTVEAIFDADTLSNGAHGGLTIYESATRAFTFGPVEAGGVTYLRLREWTAAGWVTHYTAAMPAYPAELALRYHNGTISCGTAGPWAQLDTVTNVVLTPRWVGVYIANDPTLAVANLTIDEIRVQYALSHNNVEIIELPLSEAPAGTANKFHFFVHRDPNDAGTYDLKQAQRILDKAKSGHTMGRVGESDCFLCDDSYSLTDRDVLGQ